MSEKIKRPNVQPCDWITIGDGKNISGVGLDAVVCTIYNDIKIGSDIEVVYLDRGGRAINEDVVWKDEYWDFKHQGPCGGYADNYSRLSEFVAILRRGRWTLPRI